MKDLLSDVELTLLREFARNRSATTLRRPLSHKERIAFNKLVDARLITKTRYRANFPPTVGITDQGRKIAKVEPDPLREDTISHSYPNDEESPLRASRRMR